ncbi:MAG: tRNA dihydrouridine(20/20a) synthase DusA [Caulobacterales bacterium]|nr:tRNA dihydrouridine(20/20a) synthase DusA [Caulobacterales bacterium]
MIDRTDRHCRRFHRMLTRRALLFTEMVVDQAILRGDAERLLGFDAVERPLALQLGGSDPETLAAAARIGEAFGYDEINLNVGCPSDRVKAGRFGACLMREPGLVAACVSAMRAAVAVPVTVKCRIGVDDQDPQEALFAFVDAVAAAGCTVFYVHARKAWLSGLSPKENRTIPPLDYDLVRRLKAERPDLTVILNGGLMGVDHALGEGAGLDGAMLGRAAYETPWTLIDVDPLVFGADAPARRRSQIVAALIADAEAHMAAGRRLHALTRHIGGLFHGAPGARAWRRILSEEAVRPGAGPEVIARAAEATGAAQPV